MKRYGVPTQNGLTNSSPCHEMFFHSSQTTNLQAVLWPCFPIIDVVSFSEYVPKNNCCTLWLRILLRQKTTKSFALNLSVFNEQWRLLAFSFIATLWIMKNVSEHVRGPCKHIRYSCGLIQSKLLCQNFGLEEPAHLPRQVALVVWSFWDC